MKTKLIGKLNTGDDDIFLINAARTPRRRVFPDIPVARTVGNQKLATTGNLLILNEKILR